MATSALLSTVVMGGLLLVIIALVLRLRSWEHPAASAAATEAPDIVRAANGPLGWSIAFFVAAFSVMGLAVLYTAGSPVAGLDPATLGMLVLVILGAFFILASLVAVYSAVRSRGLNSAQAAGVSSLLLATLVLLAIVAQLFIGG